MLTRSTPICLGWRLYSVRLDVGLETRKYSRRYWAVCIGGKIRLLLLLAVLSPY